MGASAQYSSYNVSGIRSTVVPLSPFSYRRNIFDSDAKLLLKIPTVKMIYTDNSKSYQVSGSVGFHLGILYGNYKTEKLQINGYRSDPKIEDNILKSSFVISIPTDMLRNYVIDLSATNTRFYGTNLYIENAMDYGIGFVKTANANNNEMRLDIKYYSYDTARVATIGNGSGKVEGVSVNLKFQY